jgi:hypothetical protein
LRVASALLDGPTTKDDKKYTCTATVTIKPAGSTSNVSGATVYITWASVEQNSGFPYDTTAVTAANGVATSVSKKMTTNNGCSFTVKLVTAAGYLPLVTQVTRSAPV